MSDSTSSGISRVEVGPRSRKCPAGRVHRENIRKGSGRSSRSRDVCRRVVWKWSGSGLEVVWKGIELV